MFDVLTSICFVILCREATSRVRHLQQGLQTQTPLDRTYAAPLGGEAVPVRQVWQAFLPLGLLLPAHEPPLLLLQEGDAEPSGRAGEPGGGRRDPDRHGGPERGTETAPGPVPAGLR